jgi:hypothetical protein
MCYPSHNPILHRLCASGKEYTLCSSSLRRLATDWTVRGPNPGGRQIFRTLLGRPWSQPSLQYKGNQVSSPGVKRSECDGDHPPHLAPRSKQEYSHTSTARLCFMAYARVNLAFTSLCTLDSLLLLSVPGPR